MRESVADLSSDCCLAGLETAKLSIERQSLFRLTFGVSFQETNESGTLHLIKGFLMGLAVDAFNWCGVNLE